MYKKAILSEQWIDLTMPISPHIRWNPILSKKGDFDKGDIFEATTVAVSCHAFTHMDAQKHIKKMETPFLTFLLLLLLVVLILSIFQTVYKIILKLLCLSYNKPGQKKML